MDLTLYVAELLGVTPYDVGAACAWIVFVGAVAGVIVPWLEARLPDWRASARATRTLADDYAVRFLGWVVTPLVWAMTLAAWIVPRFRVGLDASKGPRPPSARIRRRPPPLPLLALTIVMTLPAGCGASQASALHHGLDLATDYADPLYAAAVVECDAAERWVIAHYEPDEVDAADAALSRVRRRCDAIFAAFEEARALQGALRATADAIEDGRATLSDLTHSVDEVLALARSTRELVETLRGDRERGAL